MSTIFRLPSSATGRCGTRRSGAGFIRFAQSAGGNYDAVCFDARAPQRNREFRIVRLDHESILIKQQIDVREEIAPSFVALVESLLAS
jgi:hypothetical protein